MGFFDKIKQGLTKTKTKMDAQLTGIFAAYAPGDEGVDGATATGLPVDRGVVAVDPKVIPLGSVVYFLLRKESADKVAELRSYWGVSAARAVPVFGDLKSKKLGVAA